MSEQNSLGDAAQDSATQLQALQVLVGEIQRQVSALPEAPLTLQDNVKTLELSLAQLEHRVTLFRPLIETIEHNEQQLQIEMVERQRAEQALWKIVEFNQQLISSLNVGIAVCDRTLRYRLWNRFMEELSGYTSREVLGREVFELLSALQTAGRRELLNRALQGETVTAEDFFLKMPLTDKSGWFSMQFSPFQDEAGAIIGIIVIAYDVTHRHQSEAALRVSEEKFHKAFRASPVMLAIATLPDGVLLDVNDSFLERYSCQRDQVIGHTSLELGLWKTPTDRDRLIEQLQRDGTVRNLELTCCTRSGETLTVLLSAEFIQIERQPCMLVASIDISDLKHAEAQLRASVTDKDALLREVHHRVKNNLQIISSLLDLQSNRVTDLELRNILLDSQNRISSMALVHENLYCSDTFARINFTQYIYQLSTHLFNSLRRPDDEIEMHLAIAPNILVSLVQAVPCGLLLNELITNAIKHGLPATGTGRLSIECGYESGSQIGLKVSTNSNNLKTDFAPEQASSLGMRLIVTLVKQLKGTLEVIRANPTTFVVQFPAID